MADELWWAVKPSLLNYVAALGDGGVQLAEGARGSLITGFTFPVAAPSDGGAPPEVIEARGVVTLVGHGVRILEIRDPQLVRVSDSATLSVRRWAGRETRLTVAIFGPSATTGELTRWEDGRLQSPGRELFDFRYPEGETLGPVELRHNEAT